VPQVLGRPEIGLPSAGAKTNELIAKQMIEHWLWTINKQLQDLLQSTVSFLNTPKSAILHNTWEHMDKHGHDVIHPWKFFFWGGGTKLVSPYRYTDFKFLCITFLCITFQLLCIFLIHSCTFSFDDETHTVPSTNMNKQDAPTKAAFIKISYKLFNK